MFASTTFFKVTIFFSVAEPSSFKPGLLPSFPFSVQIRGNLATSGRKKLLWIQDNQC